MNTENDNYLTSKQWISSCYAMTESGTAIVVHEKEVTIDKTTHDIKNVKNNLRLIKDPKEEYMLPNLNLEITNIKRKLNS